MTHSLSGRATFLFNVDVAGLTLQENECTWCGIYARITQAPPLLPEIRAPGSTTRKSCWDYSTL